MPRLSRPVRWHVRPLALALIIGLITSLVPALPASADPTVELLISWESNRDGPTELDAQTLSGDVYVFGTTSETVVDQVSFWIDDETMTGAADRVDSSAPFDLVGGTPTAASAWDTTELAAGEHTVTVKFEYPVLADQSVTATFVVDNVDGDIYFSTDSDRTPPERLDGSEVEGDIYAFVRGEASIEQVSFWIDDEEMSGPADRVDSVAPFDLVGGDEVEADPLDTNGLTNENHSVTVRIEIEGLDDKVSTSYFNVWNGIDLDLYWSETDDRSSPEPLSWESFLGDIYVFTLPDDPAIEQVSYWIDDEEMSGSPERVDIEAPFDLAGGDVEAADPFDTTSLGWGEHSLTLKAEIDGQDDIVFTRWFEVDNVPEPTVVYSTSSDRSDPDPLEGATVDGDVFVFTLPEDPTVVDVSYWVDDPWGGSPHRVDDTAPYDLEGNSGASALPFDITALSEGRHDVYATVTFDGAPSEDLEVGFFVDNLSTDGVVAGTVFIDVDSDGVFDAGTDEPIVGTEVAVFEDDGETPIGTTSTLATGQYQLAGIAPQDVVVKYEESGWMVATTPRLVEASLSAGVTTTVDFGLGDPTFGGGRNHDVDIDPGYVRTRSGDGDEATVDGGPAEASFRDLGDLTFANGQLYVASQGSVRVVDTASGLTSTLAGDASATGCVDDADPETVRFGALSGIGTDGVFLYVADPGCGSGAIRRVLSGSGATETLTSLAGVDELIVGSDQYLYATTGSGLYRVDRATGTTDLIATASVGYTALTADNQYLWVVDGDILKSVDVSDGDAVATVADLGTTVTAMEAAGSFLYLATGADGSQILRYNTDNDAQKAVAGTATPGFDDGTGIDAAFDTTSGLVTDGETALYLTDAENHRIRSVAHDQFFAKNGHAFGWDGYGAWAGGLNAGLGAYVTSNTDFDISTVGLGLELTRTYNSLDFFEGPFGVGWSFGYEMSWRRDGEGNVAILYPDGRREIYEKQIDDSFDPPEGYFSELETDGEGFVLTSRDDTVYTFDGDGLLTEVADRNGHTLTLTYSDGKLDVVEDDTSGRTLDFTWDGERISQVATPSVTAHGGALVWKYYYDGDARLVEACDPRDNTQTTGVCWTYQYTDDHQITRVTKPEGNIQAEIEYEEPPIETSLSPIFVGGSGSFAGSGLMAAPLIRLAFDILPPAQPPLVSRVTDGEGGTTVYDRSTDFVVRTRDPRGFYTTQTFDERFRLISEKDPAGKTTTYGYNADGHRDQITDPNGNTVQMTFDERGNRTSDTNGELETSYLEYDEDDNLITRRDGRSADEEDNSYATVFDYDTEGNKISEVDAEGNERIWEYTGGSESAIGGGTMPAGLLEREITPRGNEDGATPADFATVYEYDSQGDLRRVTTPSGLVTEYSHDEIGRVLTQTVTDSEASTAAVSTTSYDQAGNMLTVTAPEVANSLESATHQLRKVNVYDDNSNLTSATLEDTDGDDPDRVTTFTYDDNDRQLSVTDPENGTMSRVYDKAGNVVRVTDQEGRVVATVYSPRNQPTKVIARNFVDDPIAETSPRHVTLNQYSYDPAGRKLTETDAEGRVKKYTYDDADRVVFVELLDYVDAAEAERDVVLSELVYDNAGNLISETAGDGTANERTTSFDFDNASRPTGSTLDPGGLDRVTVLILDGNGNVEEKTVTEDGRTETTTMVYDEADRLISQTVENGTVDLETTFGYDERGNQTTVTDPRGNLGGATPADYTTTSEFDVAGRLVTVVGPEVEEDGGPGTDTPTTSHGYNTFGERTHTQDPRGNTTVSVFDDLGRLTEVHHPEYTQPGEITPLEPVELFDYDAVGNLIEKTSRRGETTTHTFDNFNRVVQQVDPLLTGELEEGEIRYEYDDVGNRTATENQVGARTEWTHDKLNRVRTHTQIVRQDVGDPLELVTTLDHDDLGNQTYLENPEEEVTEQAYNPAGELLTVTDPLNEVTSYQWQLGRQVRVTDPLGRYTVNEYDLAGRLVEVRRYSPTDTLLTTTGHGYNAVGNRTETITPRGFELGADPVDFTTTLSYDPLNRLTEVVTPVSDTETITTSYGYDLAGNLTMFTDGNSNTTTYTYNPWNLRESTIEPSTTAHPDSEDRTWTTSYDAGGLPIGEALPGGVVITRAFDEMARLTGESGTGDGSASRSFGHDLAGNQTSVSHPDGTIGFEYDDRNLLVDQTGPAGSATFGYDNAGRLTNRVDIAGTHAYTWTARGELDTLVEPLSGTTLDYTWNEASELQQVDYGISGAVRTFSYDHLGRLTSDTLTDDTPATATATSYQYDSDGNVVERDIDLPGNADEGLHEYEYDNQGRLESWTHDLTTTSYVWDDAGNRLEAEADSYTYDQRNRLLTGPEGDYTYTARGTLTEVDPGTTSIVYDFDPLGRLTSVDSVDYSYDGLDRVAGRETDDFTYQGFSLDPTSDGTLTYSRSPGGHLVGISDGVDDLLVGTDRHGDLTHLFQADGTITDTALYDPYGDPLDTSGTFDPQVGYQTDWTDPTTNHVWMGARWYDGTWANFLSRDTIFGELSTPISLNRYTYAWANPLLYWDPNGQVTIESANSYDRYTTRPVISKKTVGSVAAMERMLTGRKTTRPASVRSIEAEKVQVQRTTASDSGRGFWGETGHQVGGFLKGFGSGLWNAARGLGDTLALGYRSGPANAVSNPFSFVGQWKTNLGMAAGAARNPGAFFDAAVIEPFRVIGSPWHQGNQGETIGRSTAFVAELILGAKLFNRLARVPTTANAVDDLATATTGGTTSVATQSVVGAADDVGLSTRGFTPSPGTRVPPDGIPHEWRITGTDSAGGTRYYDPSNPGNSVRVMQGNPNSPFPNSQAPHVRWQQNGQPLDEFGNKLPTAKDPAAHIPLENFNFLPELFR